MNLDGFAAKGSGHAILQDSVLHFENEKYLGILISDGCSSSPKSEIGANLLPALFKESFLESQCYEDPKVCEIVLKACLRNKILEIIRHTGFCTSVFDATLIAVVINKETMMANCYSWGDSYWFINYINNEWDTFSFNYPDTNAPRYFSYDLDEKRKANYHKLFGDGKAYLRTLRGDDDYVELLYSFILPAHSIKSFSIFSDGIATFYKDRNGINELIPVESVISDLTNFKGYAGEFVKRRVLRYLRDSDKQGIKHYDDVSVGCINFSDESF